MDNKNLSDYYNEKIIRTFRDKIYEISPCVEVRYDENNNILVNFVKMRITIEEIDFEYYGDAYAEISPDLQLLFADPLPLKFLIFEIIQNTYKRIGEIFDEIVAEGKSKSPTIKVDTKTEEMIKKYKELVQEYCDLEHKNE